MKKATLTDVTFVASPNGSWNGIVLLDSCMKEKCLYIKAAVFMHPTSLSFIRLLFSSDHIASRRHNKYVYEELEKKDVEEVLPRTKVRL